MEQSLIAIIYQDETKAKQGLQILQKLHQTFHLDLKNATIIVRRSDGQVVADGKNGGFSWINPKYGAAGVAGTVAGLIGAAPLGPVALLAGTFMGGVGTVTALGYDLRQKELRDGFRQKVQAEMPKGSSAIIIEAVLNDETTVFARLGQIGEGTIIQQPMNPGFLEQVRKVVRLP